MEAFQTLAADIIQSRLGSEVSSVYTENQDTITLNLGFKLSDDPDVGHIVTTQLATVYANKVCDDVQQTAQICKEQHHPEKSCVIILSQNNYEFDPVDQGHRYTFKFRVYFN